MASLSSIRDGLATNLATISGLRTHATFPADISPPAAAVVPASPAILREAMARGVMRYRFKVTLVVSRASDRAGQDRLDAYLASTGADSVWVAIESDRTLGGAAHDTHVVECSNYGEMTWANTSYLAAEFEVEVLAK